MKKISHNHLVTGGELISNKKQSRESVWCEKYGYFIDLDACRARSLQQKICRRRMVKCFHKTVIFEDSLGQPAILPQRKRDFLFLRKNRN
ncbi:MAG TPA: hypothetical protein DCR81_08595 [Smithella sp.]|jgi:hypothetical protein|nr:hypothetical protein [Smithella sp.]